MATQYKDHKSVPAKYKWDLSFLLEGKTPEKYLEDYFKKAQYLVEVKDSKYSSSKAYLDSIKKEDELMKIEFRLTNYITNAHNLNIVDAKIKELLEKYQYQSFQLKNAIGPEAARFFANSKKIAQWAKEPEFKEYRHHIEKSLEEKKYQLPKAVQEYNLKVSRGKADLHDVFGILTDSEIDFGYATSTSGKKVKVTRANRSQLAESKDKSIRKTSFLSFREAYLGNKASLASLLYQHKKQESASILARGFNSSVEGLIFGDRVDEKFLQTLYKAVQDNAQYFKPYRNAHKKFYKARFKENITRYDWAVKLVNVQNKVTVDQSIKETIEALKPFGKEYSDIVKSALTKENWVDYMAIDNKRSGAYSIGGTYGIDKKLILMNFDGTMRSTETLAHEMGHSMHSYYSDKVQKTVDNSSYPIFLAEIASIFNELMLHDYWLKNIKDKKTKFSILGEQIDGFIGTVFRQTEWSNYEYNLYAKIDKGEPVGSYDALAKMYYDNSLKYAIAPKRKYDPKDQYASIYVPHFYYGFYVYKYAIGQLVANIFFAKYKNEGKKALEFYIEKFLSAGGHLNPLDILKEAGIDLHDPASYELGFQEVKRNIKEYIKLGKEIFKV